jgi:TolB-like protein
LSAILSADVAGYSRLMAADEAATVATLNACRAVFRDAIAAEGGRVVDTAGDSVLSVFDSAVAAVACALAVQERLAEHNADLADERRMDFRIGINLGDIIEQADGSVYGDGVNIASRLEGLATPGGLMVSANIQEVAEGKLEARFADAGAHQVKNIAKPVRAYRVEAGPADKAPAAKPIVDQPSIVVLPFENMSGDPEQAYFSDGISEDVITELSKVPGLFVIARNSAFVYKGQAHNLPDVAAALGVRYVLEGSVRKAGNRVRITAQLIDGDSGGHLWAERYDRDLEDIFAVQDEVTEAIVGQLSLKLAPEDTTQVRAHGMANMEAYELFLRGRLHAWGNTHASNIEAQPLLRQVIALEPGYAPAHAMLGFTRVLDHNNQWGETPESGLEDGFRHAEAAVAADAGEPLGHFVLGMAHLWSRQLDEALSDAEHALTLDPNLNHAHMGKALIQHFAGDSAAAIVQAEMAMRLDPHYPNEFLHFLAVCRYMLGDFSRSRTLLEQRIRSFPETDSSRMLLAACLGRLGEAEAAQAQWRDLFAVNPGYSLAHRRSVYPYRNPADFEAIVDGLRLAKIDPDEKP